MTNGPEMDLVTRGELPPRLLSMIARSQELDWASREAIGDLEVPLGIRPRVAQALYALALEHANGILSLLAAGNPHSALALLRPQAEALGRASWARYVAEDAWLSGFVGEFPSEEALPQFHKRPERVLADLQGKAPQSILYSLGVVFSDSLLRVLHELTHGGRGMVVGMAQGHVAEILLEAVLLSNALTVHAIAELVSLCAQPGSQAARRVNRLSRVYRDCFRKVPHGWQRAPGWGLPPSYLHGHSVVMHLELNDTLGLKWEAWAPGLDQPHTTIATGQYQ